MGRNVVFTSDLTGALSSYDAVIFVDYPAETVWDFISAHEESSAQTAPKVFYWASLGPDSAPERASNFLRGPDSLTAGAVTGEPGWVKMWVLPTRVVEAADGAGHLRSAADVSLGLSALQCVEHRDAGSDALPELSPPSVLSALLDRVIPVVKPVKRYLPQGVIIRLYKLLARMK
ncbi:hypothetical protein [Corynebacterium striatum]|uniref:hypothetical protein n=1 Tax=Corynebacterium striatum TaxID=43770 RepID=UPI0012F8F208|nr:hypothetical protein [Corynebacterium striatum]